MPLVNILVGPADRAIATGETLQYRAVAIDNRGQAADITASATWASTNQAVATVAPGGLASAVAPGTATIQAIAGGVTGSAVLGVEVTLASMVITPTDVVMSVGQTQQFTAIGHYSDGSIQDLTVPASFVSSNPGVVTVDNLGLARGVAPGTGVIEARYGSVAVATSAGVTASMVSALEELLIAAKAQMARYAAGQAVVAIETPQLGKVVYSETNIAQLQALIDRLTVMLYPETAYMIRRRPVSVEGCP